MTTPERDPVKALERVLAAAREYAALVPNNRLKGRYRLENGYRRQSRSMTNLSPPAFGAVSGDDGDAQRHLSGGQPCPRLPHPDYPRRGQETFITRTGRRRVRGRLPHTDSAPADVASLSFHAPIISNRGFGTL
jgi:hypothetical protein